MKKWMLIVAVVMVFAGYGHAEEGDHTKGQDQPVVQTQDVARPTVDLKKLEQEFQKAVSACSEDRPQS